MTTVLTEKLFRRKIFNINEDVEYNSIGQPIELTKKPKVSAKNFPIKSSIYRRWSNRKAKKTIQTYSNFFLLQRKLLKFEKKIQKIKQIEEFENFEMMVERDYNNIKL